MLAPQPLPPPTHAPAGQVKCPVCSKVSRTFDPFNVVSLPVPKQHERTFVIIFVPRGRTTTAGRRPLPPAPAANGGEGAAAEAEDEDAEEDAE